MVLLPRQPIFLVIGPDFTEDSDIEASKYKAKFIDRNIVLITAKELKALAEDWDNVENKRHDEPFPLALLGDRAGRIDINHIKRVFEAK